MNKILKINVRDIIYDCTNAASILNKSCHRGGHCMVVKTCFRLDDNVLFCLEDDPSAEKDRETHYVISKIDGLGEDAIIGEINSRYAYGFSTTGCFEYDDRMWGIFETRTEGNS